MDQRRYLAFLVMSVAVLMLWSLLFQRPQPQQQAQPGAPAAKQADQQAAPAAEEKPPAGPAADLADLAEEPDATQPLRYVTLGSLDSSTGYRMLVTLTNAGAAVRRVELSGQRFRNLNDRSGYLGDLELQEVDGKGLRVQVVGPGTPAAEAGLQPGDLIVGIGNGQETDIGTAKEFQTALSKTRPRRKITLQVVRDDAPPKPMTVALGWHPFEVMRPEIENILMRGAEVPEGFKDRPSFLLTLASLQGQELEDVQAERLAELLEEGHWEVAQSDESSVTFRRILAGWNLELLKRFTLKAVPEAERSNENYPGYDLHMELELRNTGDEPKQVAYRLDGPNGLPIEGWWYSRKIGQGWGMAGLRDVVVRFYGAKWQQIVPTKIVDDKVDPMGQERPLAYAGVDAQYFSAVLIPQKPLDEVWFDVTEAILVGPKPEARTPKYFANVTCRLFRRPIDLQPNESHKDSFDVFIGPKRPELLTQYQAADDPAYSLSDLIYYGWFGPVARVMISILHFFYGIVGNYGLAIIMLTVVVRGAMFPVSFKQTQNMARMQALKPELDRISEKYKSDMQKKQQAMQELYRKHKINPLGGCLPLFLQMPVFIGLYRSLMVDVELWQSPLFGRSIRWCSNLAAPDMLLNWSSVMPRFVNDGIGILGLGPYLNVLPLVTVVLFLMTQKMAMPAPTTDQAAMQQKMMKYMTLFIGLLFYKVASGLCLYFIASSLWGIAERKLLPKAQAAGGATDAKSAAAPGTGRDKSSGGSPSAGPNGKPGKRKSKAKRKR